MELLIGDEALIAGFPFPQDRDFVFSMRRKMPVDAIVGNVGFGPGEPTCKRRIPFEHAGPLFEPVKLARGELAPELLRIFLRTAVQFAVRVHAWYVGFADELVAWRINV